MVATDQQVRKLFMEYQRTWTIESAAMKAGMTRKTAAAYIGSGQLPSERKAPRDIGARSRIPS